MKDNNIIGLIKMSSKVKKDKGKEFDVNNENSQSKEKGAINQGKKIKINKQQINIDQQKRKKGNLGKSDVKPNIKQINIKTQQKYEDSNKQSTVKNKRLNSSNNKQNTSRGVYETQIKNTNKKDEKKLSKQNSKQNLKRIKSQEDLKNYDSEKEDNNQNKDNKLKTSDENPNDEKKLEIKKSQKKLIYLEKQLEALEKKQKQIQNANVTKKQNYEELINRFRELAGKQIGSANEKKFKSLNRLKQSEVISPNLIYNQHQQQAKKDQRINETPAQNNIFKQTTSQAGQIKFEQSFNRNLQKAANAQTNDIKIKPESASPRKTKIKFITQKQHELKEVLDGTYAKPSDMFDMKYKLDSLNSTRRSLSLPMIVKNGQKGQRQQLKTKTNSIGSLTNRQKRGLSSDQRVQKQRNLNEVAFMLTNLKQKVGREGEQKKNQYNKSKIIATVQDKIGQISENNSFFSQSPNKLGKSNVTLMQLSSSPSKTMTRGKQKQLKQNPNQKNIQLSNQIERNKNDSLSQNISAKVQNKQGASTMGKGFPVNNKVIEKQAQLNNELQQIKQDIQNENNEKEQLLKQHRSLNKNLQIDMLRKRERINKLQAQINKYKLEEDGRQPDASQDQTRSVLLTELKQQKIIKQKQYKQEKDKLKQQIQRIQKKIAEQEEKYKNLRESQIQIKNQQLDQREKQLEQKNKQISSQLEARNKQLEQIIKKEQQKSKIYKQQLVEQAQKNQQISIELKKQEELQKLLLEQIERITRERKSNQEKKEQQKNKEKLKLIQEIKQLQQVQNRILMEFQRDSQAANSMFEAMRLKNIELEAQINKRKKEKQKKNLQPQPLIKDQKDPLAEPS